MPGALDGIRVVEVASYVTGPYAAMLLGDLGADVIKVEDPDGGDPFRGYEAGGYASQYRSANRTSGSVALDLKTDAGRDVFHASPGTGRRRHRELLARRRRPPRHRLRVAAAKEPPAHLLLDHRLRRRTARTATGPGTTRSARRWAACSAS